MLRLGAQPRLDTAFRTDMTFVVKGYNKSINQSINQDLDMGRAFRIAIHPVGIRSAS
jgi:hypothetical protein